MGQPKNEEPAFIAECRFFSSSGDGDYLLRLLFLDDLRSSPFLPP